MSRNFADAFITAAPPSLIEKNQSVLWAATPMVNTFSEGKSLQKLQKRYQISQRHGANRHQEQTKHRLIETPPSEETKHSLNSSNRLRDKRVYEIAAANLGFSETSHSCGDHKFSETVDGSGQGDRATRMMRREMGRIRGQLNEDHVRMRPELRTQHQTQKKSSRRAGFQISAILENSLNLLEPKTKLSNSWQQLNNMFLTACEEELKLRDDIRQEQGKDKQRRIHVLSQRKEKMNTAKKFNSKAEAVRKTAKASQTSEMNKIYRQKVLLWKRQEQQGEDKVKHHKVTIRSSSPQQKSIQRLESSEKVSFKENVFRHRKVFLSQKIQSPEVNASKEGHLAQFELNSPKLIKLSIENGRDQCLLHSQRYARQIQKSQQFSRNVLQNYLKKHIKHRLVRSDSQNRNNAMLGVRRQAVSKEQTKMQRHHTEDEHLIKVEKNLQKQIEASTCRREYILNEKAQKARLTRTARFERVRKLREQDTQQKAVEEDCNSNADSILSDSDTFVSQTPTPKQSPNRLADKRRQIKIKNHHSELLKRLAIKQKLNQVRSMTNKQLEAYLKQRVRI